MKKLLLIFFTFHFSLFTLKAQGVWSPRNPLPNDSGIFQGASFSIGNYGYAVIGETEYGKYPVELWQFDPSSNSWSRKADFPGSARVSPATFVIGTKAYIVTGSIRNGGSCVDECWQYDATNNTWTQKTNFPGAPRVYGIGFPIEANGYVGLGADELHDFYKDFYEYDTTGNGAWTKITDFGGIARSAASGFSVGGKGFVCFGQDSLLNRYQDMWEYDPGTNTWKQKSSYHSFPTYVTSGFVIGKYIYIGSGEDTAVSDSRFWQYNTQLDSWTRQANIPKPTGFQGPSFSIADTGYYGMGLDSISEVPNKFSRFIPSWVLGIDELNFIGDEISIFPNPIKISCTILLSETDNHIIPQFTLSDMKGKEMEINITKYSSDNYILQRGNLKAGEYLLSLILNNKQYFKKIVVVD